MFHIELEGQDHLKRATGSRTLLAPKHSSRWDPLILALIAHQPLRFVAAHTEFRGLQGWLIHCLGTVSLDRERPHLSTLREIESILAASDPLVIFPEGGIRPAHRVGSLKPGLGRLAIGATRKFHHSIQVIPIAITYDPAPQWGATVRLQVAPPLQTSDYLTDLEPADQETLDSASSSSKNASSGSDQTSNRSSIRANAYQDKLAAAALTQDLENHLQQMLMASAPIQDSQTQTDPLHQLLTLQPHRLGESGLRSKSGVGSAPGSP